ncbi:MAG: DUF47 domain-containing protein, partial [Hyphomicrobiaceae bacterium]
RCGRPGEKASRGVPLRSALRPPSDERRRPASYTTPRDASLDDAWLDDVVAGSRKAQAGSYRIPHGPELLRRISAAIATMLECLPAAEREQLQARAEKLELPTQHHGAISGQMIAAMTSVDRRAGDSLHLVVMDAHKAINRLQAATAPETVAGAKAHGLSSAGRVRVQAFTQGLNRTAPLKFDHPGLGTTATEHDGRLLIQNDIGTTDAHVLVVRIEKLIVTVTYTDVHRQRLEFFKSLLDAFEVHWDTNEERNSKTMASGQYILASGRFEARTESELLRYLEHLGSRIVFLIDWNHMRKRLRGFVDKRAAIGILRWAADKDYGHRALIEIGGERALAEAVEHVAGNRLRYGERLDQMIGEDNTIAFLKDALRLSSVGLQQRRSRRNIKDEIKACLFDAFEKERLRVFDLAAEHAAIGFDLASALVEALARQGSVPDQGWLARFASRACAWEKRADQLLNEARDDVRRFERPRSLLEFLEHGDDAVDELEEAAALVELASVASFTTDALAKLRALAELALSSARELVRAIEYAATVSRSDIRDDLDEFMAALERLIAIEHGADDALRSFRRWMIESVADQRQLMTGRELAQAIENTTDACLHAGQALRTYLIDEVIA